jgi:O-antigen ligase
VVAGIILGLALAFTSTGAKLISTAVGTGEARGTVSARAAVYETVTSYVSQTPSRLLVGVGFGPDFMNVTGADVRYEGTQYVGVRAPHNILLNTFARLGVIGVLAQLVVAGIAAAIGWRKLVADVEQSPAEFLACVCLLLLPVLSLFGVILESPFGAVPYYWALGLMLKAPGDFATESTSSARPKAGEERRLSHDSSVSDRSGGDSRRTERHGEAKSLRAQWLTP